MITKEKDMKTNAHYRYAKTFTADELFSQFWNAEKLYLEKPKPQKAFSGRELLSINDQYEREYLVEMHCCGTFYCLLEPFNTPHSVKIDKDFSAVLKIGWNKSLECEFTWGLLVTEETDIVNELGKAKKGIDYVKDEEVEISEKAIIDTVVEYVLRDLTGLDREKICRDGKRFEGETTIKEIIAFDLPDVFLKYRKGDCSGKCQLNLPWKKPGEVQPPQKGYNYENKFFWKKKFPMAVESFKQYFFEQIAKIEGGKEFLEKNK